MAVHKTSSTVNTRQINGASLQELNNAIPDFVKNGRGNYTSPVIRMKPYFTDLEGPLVSGDLAFEISKKVIPDGAKLFSILSDYVIYLKLVRQSKDFEPGDTLRLLAPFLIAHGLEEDLLVKTAKECTSFIRGSREAIETLRRPGEPFLVITTSYSHYALNATSGLGVAEEDTRSTLFRVGDLLRRVSEGDKQFVRTMTNKILKLGNLNIGTAINQGGISHEVRDSITVLDNLFFRDLPKTGFGPIMNAVVPIGGARKTKALMEVLRGANYRSSDSSVTGDSITDAHMLKEIRKVGGLAVAFNGNDYAINNANVAVTSVDCRVSAVLAQLYERDGIGRITYVTNNWKLGTLKKQAVDGFLDADLFEAMARLKKQGEFPMAYWLNGNNRQMIIEKSALVRQQVRKEAGTLS